MNGLVIFDDFFPPRSGWVNVYKHGKKVCYGISVSSRETAELYNDHPQDRAIYRIRVKLK